MDAKQPAPIDTASPIAHAQRQASDIPEAVVRGSAVPPVVGHHDLTKTNEGRAPGVDSIESSTHLKQHENDITMPSAPRPGEHYNDAGRPATDSASGPSAVQKASGLSAIVFFDLETTGLSTTRSRIVEIAMVRQWDNGAREFWSHLVNPQEPIPAAASAVHGWRDSDVQGQPTFRQLAADIVAFIGPHDLGGHNLLRYDLPLLQAELQRAGRPPLGMAHRRVVDTLVIFRRLEPHTLDKAIGFYCKPEIQDLPRHRATGDALASLEVFCSQLLRYPTQLGGDVRGAAAFCAAAPTTSASRPGADGLPMGFVSGQDGAVMIQFGKHRGKSLAQVAKFDPGYLRWLVRPEHNPSPALARLIAQSLPTSTPTAP